uniref:Uncharacterized protein n=1 Tax=Tanacetum cinerariifolium TaxID=118510 RepID=A0A699JRB0_TANCI|nr:hypothetical protein [Tanacetum cinerariifolium]
MLPRQVKNAETKVLLLIQVEEMTNFRVDVVKDFKEYTLRDYYCWLKTYFYWLKTYFCWYKLKLLDNAADLRLRLLEQSAAADKKMKK